MAIFIRIIRLSSPQRIVATTVALYAILHVAYSIAFPMFESWDEAHHYDYVRYLIEQRGFPIQMADGGQTEYHQPPGYYVITALLTAYLPPDDGYRPEPNEAFAQPYWYQHNKNRFIHPHTIEGWPWRGTSLNLHVMRLVGVIWGVATLMLAYHLARRLQPAEPGSDWMSAAVVALTGLNPTFIYIMASVNNEPAAVAIGAALSLVLVDVATQGLTWRRVILLGLLAGLAALAKWTMAPFTAVIVAAVLISRALWRQPLEQGLRFLAAAAIAALTGGWWYVRNFILYGDPTAVSAMCRAWDACSSSTKLAFSPRTLWDAYTGYWGAFGPWSSIRLPVWIYAVLGLIIASGLFGLALGWLSGTLSADDRRRVFVLGSVCVGFMLSTLIAAHQSNFGVQPRYLFGAHAAASTLLALGWWIVLRRWRAPAPARIVWSALPFVIAIVSLFGYILPAYAQPATTEDAAALDFANPYDVQVGDFARLIGVSVPAHAAPGSLIWVQTCWQTLASSQRSYWQYVHVVGANQDKLAGIDSVPGRGNYPTVDWQPGTVHCTDWPIELPPDALPGQYTVQTGLYDRSTLARLDAYFPDGQHFNPPIIGSVVIDAQPSGLPAQATRLDVDFGSVELGASIRLRGIEISPSPASPEERVSVTLYWEALIPSPQSYTVFIHLIAVEAPASPIAQSDDIPRSGLYQTDLWTIGGLVPDTHVLHLPADLPPGPYELRIGLYDIATGQRLPGPEPDFSVAFPFDLDTE